MINIINRLNKQAIHSVAKRYVQIGARNATISVTVLGGYITFMTGIYVYPAIYPKTTGYMNNIMKIVGAEVLYSEDELANKHDGYAHYAVLFSSYILTGVGAASLITLNPLYLILGYSAVAVQIALTRYSNS